MAQVSRRAAGVVGKAILDRGGAVVSGTVRMHLEVELVRAGA